MSLDSHKIKSADISTFGVVNAPDRLTGTAQQNKMIFDRLIREAVMGLFNGLIDELSGEGGAAAVGATEIDGVTGGDVQTVLGSLKTILDTKSATADMTAALLLKSDKSVTNLHIKSVSLNAETGVFTFTREDGSYFTIDTVLEKVATNWSYDATAQSLVLTLADGTTQSVPLSAFITETEFEGSDQIAFSVSDHKVTATVKAGSITDSMLSSALTAQLQGLVTEADGSATNAAQSETAAEGYKNTASQKASDAANSASAAAGSASAAGISADNAAGSADDAADSATAAATSASTANQKALDAEDSAEDSEAWAVGQRGGTDVPSTDETYHNNAKYWAEEAQHAAGGGVTSFNGRSGSVTPQSGDYTAAMVGADASGAAASAVTAHNTDASAHSDIRTALGNKADASALTTHTGNGDIHVTAAQKTTWNNKQNALTFDAAPTANSANPVTSGGVKTALDGKADLSGGKVPEQQLPSLGANLYAYTFTAADWSGGTLTIPASTHGFTGSSIIFQFWHLISGSYTYGTWACVESWAYIDPSTHVITLHGPTDGYAGKVVLIG